MDVAELSLPELRAIFTGDQTSEAYQTFPFYPLSAPGMPPAGVDFVAHARHLAEMQTLPESIENPIAWWTNCLYLRCLYDPGRFYMPLAMTGGIEQTRVIPGHLWCGNATGPCRPYRPIGDRRPMVMVIGKMPGQEEVQQGRNFVGPSGELLSECLEKIGVAPDEFGLWYVTNLVRWTNIDPRGGALPVKWIKDCLPLLHQEFRLVRPDYVLCLGAEATKHVCGGKNTISKMTGRTIELKIPLGVDDSGAAIEHTMLVGAVTHPAAAVRTTELQPAFEDALLKFAMVTSGGDLSANAPSAKFHYLYKLRDLSNVVTRILAEPGLKKISVDAEWHGEHPGEPGSYLRSVQFSPNIHEAFSVILSHPGGAPAFWPGPAAAMRALGRLLDRDDVQIVGSFFAADLPWLEHNGLPLKHRYVVPADINAVRGGEYAGGFDIAQACHSFDETGEFKLELMGVRYASARRWDIALLEWKAAYCKQHKLKADDLEGYGECPPPVLDPYGANDALYTRRLRDPFVENLNRDANGNDCWLPFQKSMQAFPAFLEMHMTGVRVDRQRIDELTTAFKLARADKIRDFREAINWPNFNPNSVIQCRELLFGERYNGKRDKQTGQVVRVRPEGVEPFNLRPITTTGQRKQPWERIASRGQENRFVPCTDKEVLGILAAQHPLAGQLRDIRFLDKVLQTYFVPPDDIPAGEEPPEEVEYAGGLGRFICHDGRIRSTFYQTMETGRPSSSRPNLFNLGSRREREYKRLLGAHYRNMRSIVTSDPAGQFGEPTLLVGADFSGAELLVEAVMAQDAIMLDHCLRGALDENDPNYYDIHSNIAVLAFRLSCAPTKAGLSSIGKKALRVAAKNVIFGLLYGRAAEAICRQCNEEREPGDDPVTVDQIQQIIDSIYQLYSGLPTYQRACAARVSDPRWMRTPKGRYRRFIPSADPKVQGELERQAMNFVQQSVVADMMNEALHLLVTHPRKAELGYRLLLSIYDAVLLEVPVRSVPIVRDEIIPECLVDRISFQACTLDGVPLPGSPDYRFGVSKDLSIRWDEKISEADCKQFGLPLEWAA